MATFPSTPDLSVSLGDAHLTPPLHLREEKVSLTVARSLGGVPGFVQVLCISGIRGLGSRVQQPALWAQPSESPGLQRYLFWLHSMWNENKVLPLFSQMLT